MLEVAKGSGTYIITATFYDEDDSLVVPNAVTWTLTDGNQKVVNSRSAVAATPASSITIVLSGDDLKLSDGEERKIRVDATYDSSNGTDLPLIETEQFHIEDPWA